MVTEQRKALRYIEALRRKHRLNTLTARERLKAYKQKIDAAEERENRLFRGSYV